MKDEKNAIDLEFEKSNLDKIKVYNGEFRGHKLVHIRTFYFQNDEYKPGKGVSFSTKFLPDMLALFRKAEELKDQQAS